MKLYEGVYRIINTGIIGVLIDKRTDHRNGKDIYILEESVPDGNGDYPLHDVYEEDIEKAR